MALPLPVGLPMSIGTSSPNERRADAQPALTADGGPSGEPSVREPELTGAGVVRSAKAIRIGHGGAERLFQAEIACFADLSATRKGVHMSRFEEGINEAIDEVVLGEALVIEALAERIATRVVEAQGATRSRVEIRASYPVVRTTRSRGSPARRPTSSSASRPRRRPAPGGWWARRRRA